jgi:hypothetical protein
MHTVAIRTASVAKRPSLPRELYDAFVRAKTLGAQHLRQPHATSLVWGRAALEAQDPLFGDPYPYDLGEANRRSLATLMRYQEEQGLLDAAVPLEVLFPDSPEARPT